MLLQVTPAAGARGQHSLDDDLLLNFSDFLIWSICQEIYVRVSRRVSLTSLLEWRIRCVLRLCVLRDIYVAEQRGSRVLLRLERYAWRVEFVSDNLIWSLLSKHKLHFVGVSVFRHRCLDYFI